MPAQPISPNQARALDGIAGIANDNLAEPQRHEAAARVLHAARELSGAPVRMTEPAHNGGVQIVETIAAGWDPRLVTALEFAEALPIPAIDALLGEAPRWARAMRARIQPGSAAA